MSEQTDNQAGGQIVTTDGQWQTRDGRRVTLYCTDAPGRWPVHGRVEGEERPSTWEKTGMAFSMESGRDLIPAARRIKRTVWLNLYAEYNVVQLHFNAAAADRCAVRGRSACVRVDIDVPVGHGLEGNADKTAPFVTDVLQIGGGEK